MDMKIKCKCWRCRKSFVIRCWRKDYDSWKSGEQLLQEAFYYLSDGNRELLLSNTCDDCWNELFGSEESE